MGVLQGLPNVAGGIREPSGCCVRVAIPSDSILRKTINFSTDSIR